MSRPEQAPKQSLPQVFSHFVDNLPGDPETDNTRRQVSGACYSLVAPTAVAQPETMAYATEVAAVLGLSGDFCQSALFARVMGGNELLPGMKPYAMCYGGHQFGNWAGQLGDGRAINLGEVINPQGERWTLQLKGAGPTPYSRSADGRAVVRSSVREFLCSEAMHHLGVPTTRALSLVTTGDDVVRDMFYDGNAKPEPGAIVCRVAPSFLRFGSYQLFAARGELTPLKQLVDYTIETNFSELGKPSKRTYIKWFETVCRLTAEMMVHWMRVGFVHGVMNTDNMSILGLTIDYGPYGWLDNYDPDWTPNTTDAQGRRYRFGHQPQIAMWNLAQLGNAIYPLVEDLEPLQESLNTYTETFGAGWDAMMAAKLGLEAYRPETDDELIKGTQRVLQAGETDMTLFYRNLADIDVAGSTADMIQVLSPAFYGEPSKNHLEQLHTWLGHYCARLKSDSVDGNNDRARRRERMNQVNPKFVLRNYLAQLAIDKAEQGDGSLVVELLEVMRRPYDEQPEHESFAAKRPEWARSRAGCSMLSCSS